MTVPSTIAPTLAKLIPPLASDFDGEVLATVDAIKRVLKAGGCDLHQTSPPLLSNHLRGYRATAAGFFDWRREARFCAANAKRLSEREIDFITSLARWRSPPTDKQIAWLRNIADRLRSAA